MSSIDSSSKNSIFLHPIDPKTFDSLDFQPLIRKLIAMVMRTFYNAHKALVFDSIYCHPSISHDALAKLLSLKSNELRQIIQDFKRDQLIIENVFRQSQDNKETYSYRIDMIIFLNIVKYRLIKIRLMIETNPAVNDVSYRCERCSKEYSEFSVSSLYPVDDGFICSQCKGTVQERVLDKERLVSVGLYNEQMTPLWEILKQIDQLLINREEMPLASQQFPSNSADIQIVIEDDQKKVSPVDSETTKKRSVPIWFSQSARLERKFETLKIINPSKDLREVSPTAESLQEIKTMLLKYEQQN